MRFVTGIEKVSSTCLAVALLGFVATRVADGQADAAKPATAPGDGSLKPRALSAEDEERIKELDERIDKLRRAGRFDEAIAPARQVAEVCERSLGPDHWRSCDARRSVQDLETFRDLPEEG